MTQLFKPFDLNEIPLANRIVMAPMTRSRAANNIADERTALYYAQRATAGLIVTEGSPISREGQGYLFNPSIYSDEQVAGWKLTTDSVHAVGGKIFAQLWHVGRVSHTSLQPDGGAPRSATARLAKDSIVFAYDGNGKPGFVPTSTPSALSTMEVERVVEDFVSAAANAIKAGFDGVEIHAANGYLFEQFLNPLVNDRTDRYSATTRENQLRFALEVVDGIAEHVGAGKIGIRISPYGQLFDMPHYRAFSIPMVRLRSSSACGASRTSTSWISRTSRWRSKTTPPRTIARSNCCPASSARQTRRRSSSQEG